MISADEIECIALALSCAKADAINRDRAIALRSIAKMQAIVKHYFDRGRQNYSARAHQAAKAAAGDDLDATRALDTLGDALRPVLEEMSLDGARLGMRQVGLSDIEIMLSQVNQRAVDWAAEHAGELVTQISATTEQAVADLTARALDEGWSNDELADALDSSGTFGDSRAEMIARTETAVADVQGNLIGWKESGVVAGKEWLLSDDACDDCTAYDGVKVGIDEEFAEGDPPLHPRCRCDVLPVLSEEDDAE